MAFKLIEGGIRGNKGAGQLDGRRSDHPIKRIFVRPIHPTGKNSHFYCIGRPNSTLSPQEVRQSLYDRSDLRPLSRPVSRGNFVK